MLLAQEPWYLSTADRGRRRLFPRGLVALFALAMVLVGWLALPAGSLQERLANADESDSLTVAYLHAWLNAAPDNWQLRLTLARHQALLGRHQAALSSLREIRDSGPSTLHEAADRLSLNVLERMAFESPAASPQRARLLARVAARLADLVTRTDDAVTLRAYYHRALAVEAPELAAIALSRLTRMGEALDGPGGLDGPRVEALARAAIGLGDFRLAAQLYWQAFDAAKDAGQRRALLERVARAEQSGARLPEFFVALESRLDGLSLDLDEYRWLARLALSANRLDLADRFARRMLKFSGGWRAYSVARLEGYGRALWAGLAAVAGRLSPVAAAHAAVPGARARPSPGDADVPGADAAHDPLAPLLVKLGELPSPGEHVQPAVLAGRPHFSLHGELMEDPLAHAGGAVRRAPPPVSRPSAAPADGVRTPADATRDAGGKPTLAFDDEAYRLAFQIFVANGSLEDAYAVATSAIEQVPEHWVWHIRAAEVAEWSQRPRQALQRWFTLAEATGQARFWTHVERLASGLRDSEKLNAFLEWRLAHAPQDMETLYRLAGSYERQGRAAESLELLRARLGGTQGEAAYTLRTAIVDLADRSGDTGAMLEMLREMDRLYGPDPRRAMRQAWVLQRKGRVTDAFDALLAALGVARLSERHGPSDERESGYWSTLAQLAQRMQRPALAIECHTRLLELGVYAPEHLRDLAALLATRSPARAAEVHAHGYHRFGDPDFARTAIAHWFAAGSAQAVEGFLAGMPEADRRAVVDSPDYLRQRAAFHHQGDRLDAALADYLRVHALAPQDMENRAAIVWTLLARRDARRLRATLEKWRAEARTEPALWGPFGAALLALDEPQQALPYFVWQARESHDYLWWLAYADAIEAAGRKDAAWQVRRRAWTELRDQPRPMRLADPVSRARVVALAMRFGPADEARGLLRTLVGDAERMAAPDPAGAAAQGTTLRAAAPPRPGTPEEARALAETLAPEVDRFDRMPVFDRDALLAASPAQVRAARESAGELILSHLISKEGSDAARGWLLSRYARDLARPAWAELAVALASDDHDALDHLLATVSDWLPKLDRIEAQRRLGHHAAAQTAAFELATARPDSDSAHQKLVDTLLAGGPSAGASVGHDRQGALEGTVTRVDAAMRIGQRQKIYGFAQERRQRTRDTALLADVPRRRSTVGMGWQATDERTRWQAELGRRDGAGDATTGRLGLQRTIGPAWTVEAGIEVAQPATESAALAAIGQRDGVQAGALWTLTPRDTLGGRLEAARLESGLGTPLANTRRATVEFGHRIRLDYPDLTLRAVLSHLEVRGRPGRDALVDRIVPAGVSDPQALLLPAGGAQLDLYASLGASAGDGYTRGARPFAEFGLHHNVRTGNGFSARAGLGTAILGSDRLTLFAGYSRETTGTGRGNHEIGLAYRLFY